LGRYISFEKQINDFKEDYYLALKQSSDFWIDNKNDYFPFIDNFLITLLRSYKELDRRLDIIVKKNISHKQIIKQTILESLVPLSRQDLLSMWPSISVDSLKRVLLTLQKEGYIIKINSFKNAKYIRKTN
jgi:hypothetical protein